MGANSPACDPAGVRIAWLAPGERGLSLMQSNLAGAAPTPLRPDFPAGAYAAPRFSRDGKHVLLIRKNTEVLELATTGAAPPEVKWNAAQQGIESVDYAPDGDGFVGAVAAWDGDLWLAEGEFR